MQPSGCANPTGRVYKSGMRWPRASVWLVAATTWLAARNAYAGVSSRLVYIRAPDALGCPDRLRLEHAVAERLGYNPFFPWADRTIIAEVSGKGTTFTARARLIDADGVVQGTRELTGTTSQCDDLIASLALAISITLDPMSVVQETLPPTPPSSPEAHGDDGIRVQPRASQDVSPGFEQPKLPSKEAKATFLTLHTGMLARMGVLPRVVPGIRAGVRIESDDFFVGLEGSTSLSASETGPRGGQAAFSLLLATVSPCVRYRFVAGCALGSMGSLQGRGLGLDVPRQESVLYASAGARAIAFLPLGRGWALEGHADAQKGLTLPTFQINEAEVFRPAPFMFDLGIGISMRFL